LPKLDITTFSWQKALGGEGAHGVIVLAERAVERINEVAESRPWPVLKMHNMTKNGKLNEDIFKGSTINTPSMLCVADACESMNWLEARGGLNGSIHRTKSNFRRLAKWINQRKSWIDFLAEIPSTRSTSSVCLKFVDPEYIALDDKQKAAFSKQIVEILAEKQVVYDIASYRDAPSGLRIWCGPTVQTKNIELLMPWIDWAYDQTCLKSGIKTPDRSNVKIRHDAAINNLLT